MPDEVVLRYAGPSTASAAGIGLAATEPVHFDGFAEFPAVTAQALLCVARVARTRFYTSAAMIAAIIRAADPVVTAEPDRLRFESFSVCCGVHARFDLHEDGLDVRACDPGTTNVDFNPPMREALSAIATRDPLRITVGAASVEVQTLAGSVIEHQVPLPDRWVKGFGEVQVATSRARPLFELGPIETQRFVRALPRDSRTVYWAEPIGRAVRLAATPRLGAAFLAGPARLRVLEPLVRFATGLTAYGTPDAIEPEAVAWVLALPGGRITVTLSPDNSRGFSGEGGMLLDLVNRRGAEEAEALVPALPAAGRIGSAVSPAGLTWLGVYGELGFDVGDGAYFRRRLPYPREVLRREPPRLRDARRLVEVGAVTVTPDGTALVRSESREHRVSGQHCSCPWMSRHGTSRGPCKHLLATLLHADALTSSSPS